MLKDVVPLALRVLVKGHQVVYTVVICVTVAFPTEDVVDGILLLVTGELMVEEITDVTVDSVEYVICEVRPYSLSVLVKGHQVV